MVSNILKNRPLFKECVEALNAQLLPKEESDYLSKLFDKMFPITKWGKIDWSKIDKKITIGYNPQQIIPALQKLMTQPVDKTIYIEWSTASIPVIKTNLDSLINHFDDVTCVSFEKFIFNPHQGYIIEILPSDEMTIGIMPVADE